MPELPRAELEVTPSLVVSLLTAQHPDLASLPLRFAGSGWDNVLFRLGGRLVVRLPRRAVADALMVAEQQWLPRLAAGLTVPVPAPVLLGTPTAAYPWHWSVCPWIPGVSAAAVPRADRGRAAGALAQFLAELHRPAPAEAPVSPVGRGGPLAARDDVVRARISALPGDAARPAPALLEIWDAAVAAPAWTGEPLWLHGDLHPANVVLVGAEGEAEGEVDGAPADGPAGGHPALGGLAGVVDFGDLCSGDPATDLAAAWMHFDADGRDTFRTAYERVRPADAAADPATWARARGWARGMGGARAASSGDAPALRALGEEILTAVLED
ncbi:hypothetical protein AC792_10100 [Arthrobacter sp. RIT-PI-e]|uniref:aminoglycoside phosphotransferase family protein n=1 Tax=Arthrobacter sp. RIT-PI-e TaxID=1681197 RepID=UPI000675BF96|nr:aminoglycoside phosphotransferase family protein [Arthrobacter sp. RIT-PI-e]KNC18770.1 hypothetical protein AC792_10100 [Arthrobacter sp. RIT-PI-e]